MRSMRMRSVPRLTVACVTLDLYVAHVEGEVTDAVIGRSVEL